MKNRKFAWLLLPLLLCASAILLLAAGCNDDDPAAAPSRTLQGGALQGIPLSLTTEVTRIAGDGTYGGVDNDNGSLSNFAEPYGIATDGDNLYLTEKGGHRVRKIVIATGAVSTIVPAGIFSEPVGITTDGSFLYVCDSQHNAIQKVNLADNSVTLLAGAGAAGFADNDVGNFAQFNDPYGITTDGASLYVADRRNNRIRKIVIATGAVSTIAGGATAGSADNAVGVDATFNHPMSITTDGAFLYVGDWNNFTIRKVALAAPYAVTTIAGTAGVPGDNAATLYGPRGLTTDGTYLYVSDFYMRHGGQPIPIPEPAQGASLIRRIALATGALSTLAGIDNTFGAADNVAGTSASFEQPSGITTDGISLFVTDRMNQLIRRIR